MNVVTGTYDVFGRDIKKMIFLENSARDFFQKLGFEEVRTPIIEYSDVFVKSLGDVSDVVMHQMYSFEDKDGSNIVLRPEGTAPAVRFYISKLQHSKPRSKIFYIGPMFRRERPQRGRQRQFHQIGCEIFGFYSPEADAYLIYVASSFLRSIDVKHIVMLNSVGCPKCRPRYTEEIRRYVEGKELCPDCLRRKEKNPLRILDCKLDAEKLADVPKISEYWCEDCRTSFEDVTRYLSRLSVDFRHEPRLVRGLDYYTGVVFEFYHPSDLKNAVLAGGRYDFLVEFMGGRSTPACGFAMGVERICALLPEPAEGSNRSGIFISYTQDVKEYALLLFKALTDMKNQASTYLKYPKESKGDDDEQTRSYNEKLASLLDEITKGKLDVNLDPKRSLKSQLRHADSEGYKFVLIIGKDEMSRGSISVRLLESSEQFEISLEDLMR